MEIRTLETLQLPWARILEGGSRSLPPIGHLVEFQQYRRKVRFQVSDGRNALFRCDRIYGLSNLDLHSCIELPDRRCSKVELRDEAGRLLIYPNHPNVVPLLTAREWYEYLQLPVIINGGWFLAREYRYFSYRYPCSYPKGVHISHGEILSEAEGVDRVGMRASQFDALVVKRDCSGSERLEIVDRPRQGDLQGALHALAGFRLLERGQHSQRMFEESNNPWTSKARTAVAFNSDTAWFVVVQPGPHSPGGGLKAQELATLLHELGAEEAINFDNGGSSQLYSRHPITREVVESRRGDLLPRDTRYLRTPGLLAPEDENAIEQEEVFRPVPNIIGAYPLP